MSPRTGRPKIDNPKNHEIKVRVDEKTRQAITKYAEKHNIAITETIRRAIDLFLLENEK